MGEEQLMALLKVLHQQLELGTDGVIVGTDVKRKGDVTEPVDLKRAKACVRTARGSGK